MTAARPYQAARGAALCSGAVLGAALALLLCAAPAPAALAQVGEAAGAEKPPPEKKEKFGDMVSRIFLKAVEDPFDFGGQGEDPAARCKAPSSEEEIEQSVLDKFASSLEKSWRRPEGAKAAATPAIMLEVCLGADGRALQRPILVSHTGALEPSVSIALLTALDAVAEAAPLAEPPPENGPWRRILVLFDPVKGGEKPPEAGQ